MFTGGAGSQARTGVWLSAGSPTTGRPVLQLPTRSHRSESETKVLLAPGFRHSMDAHSFNSMNRIV